MSPLSQKMGHYPAFKDLLNQLVKIVHQKLLALYLLQCATLCSIHCTVQCHIQCTIESTIQCTVQYTGTLECTIHCSVQCTGTIECTIHCTVQCTGIIECTIHCTVQYTGLQSSQYTALFSIQVLQSAIHCTFQCVKRYIVNCLISCMQALCILLVLHRKRVSLGCAHTTAAV